MTQHPRCCEALELKATSLCVGRQYKAALDIYRRLVGVWPLDASLHMQLAQLARKSGVDHLARLHAEIAADQTIPSASNLTEPAEVSAGRLAVLAYRSGLLEMAVDQLNDVVTMNRDRIDLFTLQARCLYALRLWPEAGRSVAVILDSAPFCAEACVIGAGLDLRRGNKAAATALMKRVFEVDPTGERLSQIPSFSGLPLDLRTTQTPTLTARQFERTFQSSPDSEQALQTDVPINRVAQISPTRKTEIPVETADETFGSALEYASSPSTDDFVPRNQEFDSQDVASRPESPSEPGPFDSVVQLQQVTVTPAPPPSDAGGMGEEANGETLPQEPGEADISSEEAHGDSEERRRSGRRWRLPGRDWTRSEQPVRSRLADLAEIVEREPLNNGARLELAQALEDADPVQALTQYRLLIESRDPRAVNAVKERLEVIVTSGTQAAGLQRLLGDAYMQQGAFERAIEAYSIAFDELRAKQLSGRMRSVA